MEIRPISLKEANAYVAQFHRHNKPVKGCKYTVSVYDEDTLCGVAIAGRPVARELNDGRTIEITRVCTDGTKNACSMLYSACIRIAKAMGYHKVVTYTLQSESGASLKASGFIYCEKVRGRDWNTPSRPRESVQMTLFGEERKYPIEDKVRWEKRL